MASATPPTGVQLPLVADSGESLPAAAPVIPAAADEDDEEDLFGSEIEEEAAPAAQGGASASRGGRENDKELEDSLFGGSEHPADDIDEHALFGSDDDAEGPTIDEKELFGSDDEGAAGARAQGAPEQRSIVPSEPSEMDEREIFGDMSDEEPEKIEDVVIRRRPVPSEGRPFMSLRLPNVLSIDKAAFRTEHVSQTLLEGYQEYKTTMDKTATRLLNPENCIRWRFKKGPDGQNLHDEDGRPQYESNARVVEWEDGTRTLFVGTESFHLSAIKDEVLLFEENSEDVHVCHGRIHKRLIATPSSLQSATHENLKRTQYRKFEPIRRSLLATPNEQREGLEMQQLEEEQRRRQERKRSLEQGTQAITGAFLEDGAVAPPSSHSPTSEPSGAEGPSLLDIKKPFKRR